MGLVLYIHGFLSSAASEKAVQTERWLQQHSSHTEYSCPNLTPYPQEAMATLEPIVKANSHHQIGIIGSSLGGYYATYLAQKYGLKAVLINPAVAPYRLMKNYLHQELKNYHSDDKYQLNEKHIDEMRSLDCSSLAMPDNIWLMVQTGDETLDYRDAVKKYTNCKQSVDVGGDHGFREYGLRIPEIMQFLEL